MSLGPIAFHSPRVALDELGHSGDRRLARLLLQTLQRSGARLEIVSAPLTLERHGVEAEQRRLASEALKQADQLVGRYRDRGSNRPRAFITFGNSHLAPDYIGPVLSDVLAVPYFLIDSSYQVAERHGRWRVPFTSAREAILRARRLFCINRGQYAALAQLRTDRGALAILPPFTDVTQLRAGLPERRATRAAIAHQHRLDPDSGWLLVVQSMMRGEAQATFAALAQIIDQITCPDWQLIIIGDGPQQPEIRNRFRAMPDKVRLIGRLPFESVRNFYVGADLYVWPAPRLEIGAALLEAQIVGLPVVGGRSDNAADIVSDGETGILVPNGDIPAFARTIDHLLMQPRRALDMGHAARRRNREGNDVAAASAILTREIEDVLSREPAR